MLPVLISVLPVLRGVVRSRVALHLEVLALRHQLQVLQRSRPRRVRLANADRWLWAWLSRSWSGWRTALVIVKPETVIAWHRQGFRVFWTWKSRRCIGRPPVAADVRALIRRMAQENPLWGAPRIHGELLKLGLEVSQATVAKYMPRRPTPPSQTWRTFLANHVQQIAAADFFVVPTATCRLLFVLVLLAHERRRVVHVAVTAHPTAAWTAQQLREAFPWDESPRYLVHDRDTAFEGWATTARAIGIDEVITAAHSPWQNAYAERLIESIRRECLDHIIVANERGLRRVLHAYVDYYLNLERTWRWARMRRSPDPSCRPATARSSRFPTSVVCTTATNAAPRKRANDHQSRTSSAEPPQRLRARHLLVVSQTGSNGARTAGLPKLATLSSPAATAPSETSPDGIFSSDTLPLHSGSCSSIQCVALLPPPLDPVCG